MIVHSCYFNLLFFFKTFIIYNLKDCSHKKKKQKKHKYFVCKKKQNNNVLFNHVHNTTQHSYTPNLQFVKKKQLIIVLYPLSNFILIKICFFLLHIFNLFQISSNFTTSFTPSLMNFLQMCSNFFKCIK